MKINTSRKHPRRHDAILQKTVATHAVTAIQDHSSACSSLVVYVPEVETVNIYIDYPAHLISTAATWIASDGIKYVDSPLLYEPHANEDSSQITEMTWAA